MDGPPYETNIRYEFFYSVRIFRVHGELSEKRTDEIMARSETLMGYNSDRSKDFLPVPATLSLADMAMVRHNCGCPNWNWEGSKLWTIKCHFSDREDKSNSEEIIVWKDDRFTMPTYKFPEYIKLIGKKWK